MPENPIQKMLREADALDRRRQEQIAEQVKVINRMKAKVAAAWQEGYNAGKSRAMRHMSDEPGLSLEAENPYADWLPSDVAEDQPQSPDQK